MCRAKHIPRCIPTYLCLENEMYRIDKFRLLLEAVRSRYVHSLFVFIPRTQAWISITLCVDKEIYVF